MYFSYACSIELNDKVIVTGGINNLTRIDVYNIDGWIMELPNLITGRFNHECGHYVNTDNKMVNCLTIIIIINTNIYVFRCIL